MSALGHRKLNDRTQIQGGPGYLLPGWRSEAEPLEARVFSWRVASCPAKAGSGQ